MNCSTTVLFLDSSPHSIQSKDPPLVEPAGRNTGAIRWTRSSIHAEVLFGVGIQTHLLELTSSKFTGLNR